MQALTPASLAFVGFVACTTSTPPGTAAPTATVSVTRVSAPEPIVSAAPAPATEPVLEDEEAWVWQKPMTPCKLGTFGCGKNGKTAVVRDFKMPSGTVLSDACDRVAVSGSATGPRLAEACATEAFLVINVTCTACPGPRHEGFLGIIPEMTPKQLAQAQQIVGLPASPVLTSGRAWKEAIAKAAQALSDSGSAGLRPVATP